MIKNEILAKKNFDNIGNHYQKKSPGTFALPVLNHA